MQGLWSHPTWVRGLKPERHHPMQAEHGSHPTWVRGLKPLYDIHLFANRQSHPTWVRGLKRAERTA